MLAQLHEQFIQERLYLKSVTPKTVQRYRESWGAFSSHLTETVNAHSLSQNVINQTVIAMRQSGLGAVSTNTYCRAINDFLVRLHEGGRCRPAV